MKHVIWQKSQSFRRKYNLASKSKRLVSFFNQVSGCNIKEVGKVLKIGQERTNTAEVPHSCHWRSTGLLAMWSTGSEVMRWQELKAGFAEDKWGRANVPYWTLCYTAPSRSVSMPEADWYCSVPYLANLTHQIWTFFLLYRIFTHYSFSYRFLLSLQNAKPFFKTIFFWKMNKLTCSFEFL